MSMRNAFAATLAVLTLSLAGCGGTEVYTADKTMVYRDSIYNVSNVRVFTARNEAVIGDQQTVDLKGYDKSQFNALLAQNPSVFVRQVFMLDDIEMVYQAQSVASWKDYDRMNNRFEGATKDLTRFLADKNDTQLKLK